MKKLKVILVALVVILLTLISFVGIYVKKSNVYEDIMADYLFSKNLKGSRIIEIAVDTSTEKVTYDKDGNIVENTEEEETKTTEELTDETAANSEATEQTENTEKSEYTTVDEPINPEAVLTEQNYKISKEIIEKRLDTLNVLDYKVKLSESNGKMIIEIPEDSQADQVESYLTSIGSFEIVDAEDESLLLNNDDIKEVQVGYNTNESGTAVYLTIEFDKEGRKKLEEVSSKYTLVTDETDKTVEKKVKLKMEDEEILSTYFDETITNGIMQLTVGNSTTDVEEVQEYLESAAGVSMLLNSGKMPIKYTIESEKFIKPIVNDDILSVAIYVLLGLAVLSFIYLIVKYKKYGALTVIGSIAAIDLLLLVIRYTNVYLSVESAIAFIVLVLFNIYIISNLLKGINKKSSKEEISICMKKGLLNSIDMIVIFLIIAVVFTFMTWSAIGNVGLIMFWGIVSIGLSHLIFTRALLLNSNK